MEDRETGTPTKYCTPITQLPDTTTELTPSLSLSRSFSFFFYYGVMYGIRAVDFCGDIYLYMYIYIYKICIVIKIRQVYHSRTRVLSVDQMLPTLPCMQTHPDSFETFGRDIKGPDQNHFELRRRRLLLPVLDVSDFQDGMCTAPADF